MIKPSFFSKIWKLILPVSNFKPVCFCLLLSSWDSPCFQRLEQLDELPAPAGGLSKDSKHDVRQGFKRLLSFFIFFSNVFSIGDFVCCILFAFVSMTFHGIIWHLTSWCSAGEEGDEVASSNNSKSIQQP